MNAALLMAVVNEEDIIDENIRYHLSQGIDLVCVTDLASNDETGSILAEWESSSQVKVFRAETRNVVADRSYEKMASYLDERGGVDAGFLLDADEFLLFGEGWKAELDQRLKLEPGWLIQRRNVIWTGSLEELEAREDFPFMR